MTETILERLFLLEQAFLFAALVVIGHWIIQAIWFLCNSDGAFYKPANFIYNTIGAFLSKPLFTCPPCMASVWGSAIFWGFWYIEFHNFDIWFYIPYILSLSGYISIYEESNN